MADSSGLLIRRGPTGDRLAFYPLKGELIYDTDNQVVYVGGLDENAEFKAGGLSVFGDRIKLSETIDITGRENLDILLNTTGAVRLPTGTTAQRPGVQFTEAQNYAKGMIRFNIDTNDFEGFDGTNWVSIGGGGAGENISLTFIADEINRIAGETATTVATNIATDLEQRLNQSNVDLEQRVDASILAGVANATSAATSAATTIAQDTSRNILADSLLMYDAFRVWQFTSDDEGWFGENNVLSVVTGGLLRNTASANNPRLYYLFSDNTDGITDVGDWVSENTYDVDDIVTYAGVQYKCLVSHTAVVFQTALDLDYWERFTASNEKVNADLYKNVAVHIKRVSGSGWSGKLYWDTGSGFTNSIEIADRTTTEDFRILSFDLRDVASWNGTIDGIQLELGATADDVFDIDWIAIGNEAPANYFAQIVEERNTRAVENGLISGQYSLKVDAGGYVVGYGLLATNDPLKGNQDSKFIIRAEEFALIRPNGVDGDETTPFVISQVNGTDVVAINGQLNIGPDARTVAQTQEESSASGTEIGEFAADPDTSLYNIGDVYKNTTDGTTYRLGYDAQGDKAWKVVTGALSRSPSTFYKEVTDSAWSDTEAENAITDAGEVKKQFDSVVLYNTTTDVDESGKGLAFSTQKTWTGTSWETIELFVDGDAIITGSLTADKIQANSLGVRELNIDGSTLIADPLNPNGIKVGTLSTDQLTVGSVNNFVTANDILSSSEIQETLRGGTLQLSATANVFVEKNTIVATPTNIASTGTISYGPDVKNVADYYLPANTTKGVVLYIHGGGWSSGSKDYPEFLEIYKPAIEANGYALISIEYRLAQDPLDYTNPISGPFNQAADDHAWPAQLDDVKKVLALLLSDDEPVSSNQTEWATLRNLVKDTAIMVTGESAGGHLAIMGVFEYALDTDGVWPDAVFNNVGPMDLRSTGPNDPENPFGQAGLNLRATLTENDPNKINSASPAFRLATWKTIPNYYTNNTKFFFYSNNNDTIVPPTSITPFVNELTQDLGSNQVTYLLETVGTPTPANPGNGYLVGDPNPTLYVADHNISFEKSKELAQEYSLAGLSRVLTPDSITFTPVKSGSIKDSSVTFTTDPTLTLVDSNDSKVLKAIDFEGNESVTITASTTFENTEFVDQNTVLLVQSGSPGDPGTQGGAGPRGPGRFFREISGSSWSDAQAENAITAAGFDSPADGDVVTLSNGTNFTEDRLYFNGEWSVIDLLVNGNAVIDGTLSADKLIVNGAEFTANQSTGALELNQINADKITSGEIDTSLLNIDGAILKNDGGVLRVDESAISVDQVFTTEIRFTEPVIGGDAIVTGPSITAEDRGDGVFQLVLGNVSLSDLSATGDIDFGDGTLTLNEDFSIGPYTSRVGITSTSSATKAALLVAKFEPSNPGAFALGVGSVGNDFAGIFSNNDNVPEDDDVWPTDSGQGRNTNVALANEDVALSYSLLAGARGTHIGVGGRLGTYEANDAYAAVFEGPVVINALAGQTQPALRIEGDVQISGAVTSENQSFKSLSDTPSSYGTAGQAVIVNASADGLTFGEASGGAASFTELTDTPSSTIPTLLAFVAAENGAIVYKDFNTVAGVGATPGSLAQRDADAGALTAADFIIPSDRQLKRNLRVIDGQIALEALTKVNPIHYQYNDNEKEHIGFVAQDLEEFYPELVQENDEGIKSLSYSTITAVLWKQNQELLERIEQLEKKLEEK